MDTYVCMHAGVHHIFWICFLNAFHICHLPLSSTSVASTLLETTLTHHMMGGRQPFSGTQNFPSPVPQSRESNFKCTSQTTCLSSVRSPVAPHRSRHNIQRPEVVHQVLLARTPLCPPDVFPASLLSLLVLALLNLIQVLCLAGVSLASRPWFLSFPPTRSRVPRQVSADTRPSQRCILDTCPGSTFPYGPGSSAQASGHPQLSNGFQDEPVGPLGDVFLFFIIIVIILIFYYS